MVNCIQSFVYLTFECIYDTARLKVSQQSVRIARTRNIDWVNMPIFMKPDFLNYTLELKKIKVYIYICIYFLFQLTTCNIHALFLCSFTDKETCQPAITIDTRSKRDFINAYVLLAMVTLSMLKFLFYIFLKSHWHQRDKNPEVREGRVFRKCLHLPHCPHTFSKRRDFQRSGNGGEGVARVCGSFSFLTLLKVYQATCTLAWPILATGWLLESEKAFHRYGFRGKQRKVACDSPKGRRFRRN